VNGHNLSRRNHEPTHHTGAVAELTAPAECTKAAQSRQHDDRVHDESEAQPLGGPGRTRKLPCVANASPVSDPLY
jgi:hypothetical protein